MRLRRHLKPSDFTDLLEGIPLDSGKTAHLELCHQCRETLAGLTPCFRDLSDGVSGAGLPPTAPRDWNEFRSDLRDELLARSVRRSSWLGKWSVPLGLTPPPAVWSVAIPSLIIVASLTLTGLWLARTSRTTDFDAVPSGAATAQLFEEDAAALETEALAWSEGDFFISLNELDESESDRLLELIALTLDGDGGA
jgi:hypothetical protein